MAEMLISDVVWAAMLFACYHTLCGLVLPFIPMRERAKHLAAAVTVALAVTLTLSSL